MSADQASNDKLAGFLALAKGARGRAAASIIADATGTPGLFAFGELLDLPHIKEARRRRRLRGSVARAWHVRPSET